MRQNREQQELRDFIIQQRCPFCNSKKVYLVLAAHTTQAHGVTGYELREMAGLNKRTSICSISYAQDRRDLIKKRDPEKLKRQLAEGRTPEVQARIDRTKRPEGRENQLAYLLSPEKIKRSVASMNSPEAIAIRNYKAQHRSPEVVEAMTKRILAAHQRFFDTHTKEEISENRKKAYQTWVDRAGEQVAHGHMVSIAKMVPHEAQLKAAAAAAIAIPLYHANPEWKARWRKNVDAASERRRKVPASEFPEIARRYQAKESPAMIARDYGISRTLVRRIALKVEP